MSEVHFLVKCVQARNEHTAEHLFSLLVFLLSITLKWCVQCTYKHNLDNLYNGSYFYTVLVYVNAKSG